MEPERDGGLESDSELLFQGGEKREKRLDDLLLFRILTGLETPEAPEAPETSELHAEAEAQKRDARSREPVLLAAPTLLA